eukprot:CFRG4033T1
MSVPDTHLTPHRVALLILVREFLKDVEDTASSWNDETAGRLTEGEFTILLVDCIKNTTRGSSQSDYAYLSTRISSFQSVRSNKLIKILQETLSQVSEVFIMHDLFEYAKSLIDHPPENVAGDVVTRHSIIGVFLRQISLAFESASFDQIVRLCDDVAVYCADSTSSSSNVCVIDFDDDVDWLKTGGGYVRIGGGEGTGMGRGETIDVSMELDDSFNDGDFYPKCDHRMGTPVHDLDAPKTSTPKRNNNGTAPRTPTSEAIQTSSHNTANISVKSNLEAERCVRKAAACLEHGSEVRVPPGELHECLQVVLADNPDNQMAKTLSYVNFSRARDYTHAQVSLHGCTYRPGSAATTETNAVSHIIPHDDKTSLQLALFRLAKTEYDFGHLDRAHVAIAECIRVSQEQGDAEGLAYAFGWVCKLRTHHYQHQRQHRHERDNAHYEYGPNAQFNPGMRGHIQDQPMFVSKWLSESQTTHGEDHPSRSLKTRNTTYYKSTASVKVADFNTECADDDSEIQDLHLRCIRRARELNLPDVEGVSLLTTATNMIRSGRGAREAETLLKRHRDLRTSLSFQESETSNGSRQLSDELMVSADLWMRLGQTRLSVLFASQQLLFASSTDHPVNSVAALCILAHMCVTDDGDLNSAMVFMGAAMDRYPSPMTESGLWRECTLMILFDQFLLWRSFDSARVILYHLEGLFEANEMSNPSMVQHDRKRRRTAECMAKLALAQGNHVEALDVYARQLPELNDDCHGRKVSFGSDVRERLTYLKIKAESLHGCRNFSLALVGVLEGLSLARTYESNTDTCEFVLLLASLQLEMGLKQTAHDTISTQMINILTHGTLHTRARAWNVLTDCVLGIHEEPLKSTPIERHNTEFIDDLQTDESDADILPEVVPKLSRKRNEIIMDCISGLKDSKTAFQKFGDVEGERATLRRMAMLFNAAGRTTERDECSNNFRRLYNPENMMREQMKVDKKARILTTQVLTGGANQILTSLASVQE